MSSRRRRRMTRTPVLDTSITGLVAWYDFSDATKVSPDGIVPVSTDGQAIYQVSDKSGNGNHAIQATVGVRPAYKESILRGLSVGRFDGGDMLIDTTVSGITNFSAFLVFTSTDVATTQYLLDFGGTGDVAFVTGIPTDGELIAYAMGATNPRIGLVTVGPTYIACVTRIPSGALTTYLNGVAGVAGTANATTTPGIAIGNNSNSGGANGLTGDVGEVVVYDRVLTAAELNQIGGYLAAKWGPSWTTVV